MSIAVNVRTLAVPVAGRLGSPWTSPFACFACSNLRWVIGTLPRQTGVYVPRRLSHVGGLVWGALG